MATPAEKEARKIVRQKFRRFVRNVIINRVWLMEADDDKMTLNVKKNVALFLRQKRKIGMLSKAEKSLLRTPHAYRTVADRKKLVHLFAHLPCFSKFSPKIRARLVRVVSYMILGPNRMIIRAGDPSKFLYFVLSGEIQKWKSTYDPIKQLYDEIPLQVLGAGDVHGMTEMVENVKRTTTSRTLTDVELLAVHYDDYINVLHSTLKKEWDQKVNCFNALGYFDKMDGKQVACRMAVLKQYQPLESIYSEDQGPLTSVHFVVSGECMVLQCLRMKVTAKKGKEKTFELVKIKKGEDMNAMFADLKEEKLRGIEKKNKHSKSSNFSISKKNSNQNQMETKYTLSKKELHEIEKKCRFEKSHAQTLEGNKSSLQSVESSKRSTKNLHINISDDDFIDLYDDQRECGEEGNKEDISYDDIESSSSKLSDDHSTYKIASYDSIKNIESGIEDNDETLDHEENSSLEYGPDEQSLILSYDQIQKSDTKIENHLIDVGSLTFGGIFGLGELLEHRVIMARTTVQCILIPRFFLFEKGNNPGEIWNRRRFYIECNIPSRQQLFENFLTTQKWQKFKNDLIERNLGDAVKNNPTKVEDIPIMTRIVEPND